MSAELTFRRALPADVPRIAELLAAENLPPLFIEEYLDGFVIVERDGTVIGCGGLEMYDDCGFIRSVVVDPVARRTRLGRQIAERLEDDARKAGAQEIYLFTAEARDFWLHLGYDEITFDDWAKPARMCWQYQFITQNLDFFGDDVPHTMRKAA